MRKLRDLKLWILGGECGHKWRLWHQYHNTWFGPIDFLEVPKSPITGTVLNMPNLIKLFI